MHRLVSVIISSFNSSAFIIETLQSVFNQTWKEIELIITDDCSADNTLEICKYWLDKNSSRFTDAIIITSEINTGVSSNANRGLKKARGEWIKFLGADDTLKIDCIENNMKWIESNPEIKLLLSRIEVYKDEFKPENLLFTTPGVSYDKGGILADERTADSQYRMLLTCDRIHFSPSFFISRETFLSAGGFDERFRFLEDYPLWLNLTRKGYKLYFMGKVTVNYRQHSGAINNTGEVSLINPNYFRTEDFRRIYTYPFLPSEIRYAQRFKWYNSQIFRCKWLNKNRKINRFLLTLLTGYLNPFKYYIQLKKHLYKDLKNNEFYN